MGAEWVDAAKNKTGAALIICLLRLTAVTVLGIVSLRAGVVVLQIAANQKHAGYALYQAEAAAMEGIQRLANARNRDLQDRLYSWHHGRADIDALAIDLRRRMDWPQIDRHNSLVQPCLLGSDAQLAAVEWRLAPGSSMVVTEPRLYLNRVYGSANMLRAQCLIEIGYQIRY